VNRLLIVGAGGHGKVVAEAATASSNWTEIGFLDGRHPDIAAVLDWPVIGKDTDADRFLQIYANALVAIGDNRRRLALLAALERAGFQLPVIAHPRSWVSPSAKIGIGTVLIAGAIVNAGAKLGRGCILNTAATVDHDCRIGDGVHVSPGAHIGGEVVVGDRTWIGIGAAIHHSVRIGADVMVGAGAAVVDDVADGVTMLGVPARVVSK
jgi:sugar O-acyltransferase (sialic acid O-acetyltransferase NeuD family)